MDFLSNYLVFSAIGIAMCPKVLTHAEDLKQKRFWKCPPYSWDHFYQEWGEDTKAVTSLLVSAVQTWEGESQISQKWRRYFGFTSIQWERMGAHCPFFIQLKVQSLMQILSTYLYGSNIDVQLHLLHSNKLVHCGKCCYPYFIAFLIVSAFLKHIKFFANKNYLKESS